MLDRVTDLQTTETLIIQNPLIHSQKKNDLSMKT